jgi:deoxyadenosine/deoxycytidine kinase
MSQIITIEGNIGSGKSTLLEHLKQKYNANNNNEGNNEIIFLREPVDEWENIKDENGTTILQKFYADQKAYSFSFQMMAYISRLALLKEAVEKNPNAIIITERSLVTDKMIFAKMLYDSGNKFIQNGLNVLRMIIQLIKLYT